MRLTKFSIRNYRSIESADLDFTPPTLKDGTTDPEDAVVVIRGDNGVGKSNVLRAIRAWFECFRLRLVDNRYASSEQAARAGAADAFPFEPADFATFGASPISLEGELWGFRADDTLATVLLQVEVSRRPNGHIESFVKRFAVDRQPVWESGTDQLLITPERRDRLRERLSEIGHQGHWHIPAFRGFRKEEPAAASAARPAKESSAIARWRASIDRATNPADAVQKLLFDARDSTDIRDRQAFRDFERFIQAEPLHRGRLAIVRHVDGVLELREERTIAGRDVEVPIQSLGSGEQEILAVLALVMVPGCSVVTLEEPETHLYWKTQRRLREVLVALVSNPSVNPSQLLVETHSHEFVFGTRFFEVRMEGGKTVVESKRNSETSNHVHEPGPVADALRQMLRAQLRPDDVLWHRLDDGTAVTAGDTLRLLDSRDGQADDFLKLVLRATIASMDAESRRRERGPK